MDKEKRLLTAAEKKRIKSILKRELSRHKEVIFAYIHGSFLLPVPCGDIDIAVYLEGVALKREHWEYEARLAMQNRFGDIREVLTSLSEAVSAEKIVITLGKKGSVGMNRAGKPHFTPIFSSRVVDTIGAGDAVFSYAAIGFARGLPLELILFIGNVVGALAVQIVCNKKSVEKHELLQFISVILQQQHMHPPVRSIT